MYFLVRAGRTGSSAWWRTRVGTRTVGSTAPHVHLARSGIMRATVRGLAVRRSIRAHAARISSFHGISGFITCWNSPVPHIAARAAKISSRSGMLDVSAWPSSTTSAVVRDGCVAANSAAVGNAPGNASSAASRLSESVEHRGDAVGPLLQGRQRARLRRDRTAPVPGWSKKMSRPSDVIASTHP